MSAFVIVLYSATKSNLKKIWNQAGPGTVINRQFSVLSDKEKIHF